MHKIIPVLLFAGLLFLTAASFKFYQERSFIRKSELTLGKVKGYQERKGKHQNVRYYPVIEFEDQEARKQYFLADGSFFTPGYRVGDRVEVYYLQDDPQQAKIKKFVPQWGDIIGSFVIGALLLFYSGFGFIHNFWRKAVASHRKQKKGMCKYENVSIHTS